MRWHEPLDAIFGSRAKVRILRALHAAAGDALSGREVARRTGLSHTGVLAALADLEEQDVVWPSADPSGTRFRLNRTNVVVRKGLMPLFALEERLPSETVAYLREAVPDLLAVVLFGSAARNADQAGSDLDVLIIVPDGTDSSAAEDAIDGVEHYARYGKLLHAMVWTRRDLQRAWRKELPLLRQVLEHGRVLFGPGLTEILVERAADAG